MARAACQAKICISRLSCYLSPPLFPVHLRAVPCRLVFHEILDDTFEIGEFRITSDLVCHPGPTLGFRVTTAEATLAYLPDHEPALGVAHFPLSPEWTSGYDLAHKVDLLIHDAMYSAEEYPKYVGWGHSSIMDALCFAALADVGHLALFHHDPTHSDDDLDCLADRALRSAPPNAPGFSLAEEGKTLTMG